MGIQLLWLVAGLTALVVGADLLVRGAARLACLSASCRWLSV